MKVTFIFGKGIDGCGVTRGCRIFEKWLDKQGHDTQILNFCNGSSYATRVAPNFIGPVVDIGIKELNVSGEVQESVNSSNVVIIHNFPSRKQEPKLISRFQEFVEKIDGPIVVMHSHDVSKAAMNLTPNAGELFSFADVLVTQSMTGQVVKTFVNEFDTGLIGRTLENPIWSELNQFEEYDLPFEQRRKVVNYSGRFARVKQPAILCQTMFELVKYGWTGELMGCEKSIGTIGSNVTCVFNPKYMELIQYWCKKKTGKYSCQKTKPFLSEDVVNPTIYATDSYDLSDGLKRMGSSMAGLATMRLPNPDDYGHRMEYSQIEKYMLTVPIISHHFAEHGHSPEGKPWTEYFGPLYADITENGDQSQLVTDLVRVGSDKGEWTERKAACREMILKFNDVEVLAAKFWADVLRLGRRQNKPDALQIIKSWFPSASQYKLDGEQVMTTLTALSKKQPMILVDKKQEVVKLTIT